MTLRAGAQPGDHDALGTIISNGVMLRLSWYSHAVTSQSFPLCFTRFPTSRGREVLTISWSSPDRSVTCAFMSLLLRHEGRGLGLDPIPGMYPSCKR